MNPSFIIHSFVMLPTFRSIFSKINSFPDSVFATDMINLDYLQKTVKID